VWAIALGIARGQAAVVANVGGEGGTLVEDIRESEFTGASGPVAFDENGDRSLESLSMWVQVCM